MPVYIALDAGGTKTETLVHDETGHILRRLITPGCNALDMGIPETQRRALSALHAAAEGLPGGKPDRAYCGIASVSYYRAALTQDMEDALPGWRVRWEGDGIGMISSMLGQREGCCIVCGTGSSLFARTRGRLYHIGGYGYLIDTWGSGYMLGREALRVALRYADGRGEKTLLYDLVRERLGAEPTESMPAIYAGGRPYIASFARTVFAARKAGDQAAEAIFQQNARALADMAQAAKGCFDGEFTVVMSGGIFLNFPEYAQAVTAMCPPEAHMLLADVPPVMGCALENVWADGFSGGEAFRERFKADYARLKEQDEKRTP